MIISGYCIVQFLQVDILHPLAEVQRQFISGTDLYSTWSFDAHVALLGDQLYLLKDILFVSTITPTGASALQKLAHVSLPFAASGCSLATYKSKLVLVGGFESNALWTGDIGIGWTYDNPKNVEIDLHWKTSLPPMSTIRCSTPSVINTGSPECLVVAGTNKLSDELCSVEVLIKDKWWCVGALPNPIGNLTLHKGRVYLSGKGLAFHCDLKTLKDYCADSKKASDSNSHPGWSTIPLPDDQLCHLASVGQNLLAFRDNMVYVYSPRSHSMVLAGTFAIIVSPIDDLSEMILASVVHPGGDLIIWTQQFHDDLYEALFGGFFIISGKGT